MSRRSRGSRMSMSRSRSKSLRLSRSLKRKASHSASRSMGTSAIIMRRGSAHSGNLPLIGKPLSISKRDEKIATSLACKLTLPIELVSDYKSQISVGSGLQYMAVATNTYSSTDIGNIQYYACKNDQTNFAPGTYTHSDDPGVPFKVQCLGAETAFNFTNVTNMDSFIDIYVVEPRRDIWKMSTADGWDFDMNAVNDWLSKDGFNNAALEHTGNATTALNPLNTDPRVSLFERHGFLKDFKVIKSSSICLAAGESRSYVHCDKRRHILDSITHSLAALVRSVSLRNIAQHIILRVRGGIVASHASSTAIGVGPTKINMVICQKFVFKRIKIAQRQQIFNATSLNTILAADVRDVDPDNSTVETYTEI